MSSLVVLFAILAQAPAPPTDAAVDEPPPARAGEEEEEEPPWSGTAGLGLSFFSGNVRSFTVTGDAFAEYDTPEWLVTLEADGAYGEAAEGEDPERELTAKTLGGWARGEYRVTPLLSAYTFLAAQADHPASLELRTEAELGVGVTLVEREEEESEMILRGYVGGNFTRDRRFQYFPTRENLPDVTLVSPALGVLFRYDLRFLGTFITGLTVVLLGGTAIWFYTDIVPLMDPLKSVWLVIHVFVASLATALFALAFGLSVLQLMQGRRERRTAAADRAASEGAADGETVRTGPGFLRTLPSADALESLAYRFAILGFIFWTFTLIAGSIWANDAWGRYWGFDTKEVWTFVIWVLYAGYIHARATRGWRGARSAWLSIIGFMATTTSQPSAR